MGDRRSKCCGADVSGSLADGVLLGSCAKCGESVCRVNPDGRVERLDGRSPWSEVDEDAVESKEAGDG